MSISEKQRQKKLLKKNKKRKLKKNISAISGHPKVGPSHYAKYPIHECFIPNTLFETGLGYVIITRKTPDGFIAVSAFVVDVHCLGVKNALFTVKSEIEYESSVKPKLMRSSDEGNFENVHPTCARKLIEGAVLYAKNFGFSPHPDYNDIKGIFGNIDPDLCPVKFEYGKNGKPYYIRGPNESVDKAKQIVDKLSKKCGEGNYDYILMLDEGMVE